MAGQFALLQQTVISPWTLHSCLYFSCGAVGLACHQVLTHFLDTLEYG